MNVAKHPSRLAAAVLTGACLMSSTTSSFAQGVDEFGAFGEASSQESPQSMAVEIRLGGYLPNVDDEFGNGAQPFADHFGSDNRWLVGLELDWQLIQLEGIGSFGPGVGVGFTSLGSEDFHDPPGSEEREPASEGSTLSILPIYGVGVLRIDALAQRTPVPLAFFAKAGLGYGLWWASYADGIDSADDGSSASDTVWGTHWALGAAFLLDVLDRKAAANMDASNGVNNSYVFVEWYNSSLDGFGADDMMQVGDSTWMAGLMLEM